MTFVLLTACGGDTAAPKVTPAGEWVGSASTASGTTLFTLSLTESSGSVNGSGFLAGTTFNVSGSFSASSGMIATLASPTRASVTFAATVVLAKSMSGTLSGGGFTGQAATLSR